MSLHTFTIIPASTGATTGLPSTRSPVGDENSITRGTGGEIIVPDTLAELLNRAQLAIDALTGRVFWRGDIKVEPGGTDTVFTVSCGPIQAYTAIDNAGAPTRRTRTTLASADLHLADVEGTPAALTPSSVYYIFARDTGADIVRQISTTQPVGVSGGLYLFKSGDARWILLGAFVTDTAGAPIPYRARNGRVQLRKGSSGVQTDMHCLTNGNSTSTANVSVAGLVPAYVRTVTLMVKVDNTTPATGYVIIGDGEDDTVTDGGAPVETPSGVINFAYMDVTLDESQRFTYHVNHANTRANVWVLGWSE